MQTVIETKTGYMIQCPACGWHEFPKISLPNKTWTFDGDFQRPTFHPSMNELVNGPGEHHQPEFTTRRCHFTISQGKISFCNECTHDMKNQTRDLEPWPEEQVDYHQMLAEMDSDRVD